MYRIDLQNPNTFFHPTDRSESPLVDDPTSVVNDSIRSDIVTVIRPASSRIVCFNDGENYEQDGTDHVEQEISLSPAKEVEMVEVESEEVSHEEDEGEQHGDTGSRQQHCLAEEHAFERSRTEDGTDEADDHYAKKLEYETVQMTETEVQRLQSVKS